MSIDILSDTTNWVSLVDEISDYNGFEDVKDFLKTPRYVNQHGVDIPINNDDFEFTNDIFLDFLSFKSLPFLDIIVPIEQGHCQFNLTCRQKFLSSKYSNFDFQVDGLTFFLGTSNDFEFYLIFKPNSDLLVEDGISESQEALLTMNIESQQKMLKYIVQCLNK